MKPKILYVSFAALIIVMLIGILIILISKESKIQPALQEVKPQEEVAQQQSALPDYTQQLPSTFDNRPAITLIKPLPEERPISAAEETEEKIKESQQPESLTGQGPAVSEEEPASGITKIGKHPTEIESKEMNARGIVMY